MKEIEARILHCLISRFTELKEIVCRVPSVSIKRPSRSTLTPCTLVIGSNNINPV
jgi:hypothetical protein